MVPDESPMASVILPTFREEASIGTVLDELVAVFDQAGVPFEAIVVDDASPDGTREEVARQQERHGDRIRLVVREDERGLGSAVVRGFREARGTHLLVMDADGQHPADAPLRLMQEAVSSEADVVVGTRHSGGGSVGTFGPLRRFVSGGAALLARLALPRVRKGHLTDPMSGLFLVRRDAVDLETLSPRGYKVLLEVLAHARPHQERLRVTEVPYTFGTRRGGTSKLGGRVVVDYLLHLLALGVRDRENRRFVEFAAVGASGIFVNLGLIALGGMLFAATSGLLFLANATVARLGAVAWNFTWNDRITYRDMRRATGYSWFVRFLRFNVVSATSFVVYLLVAALLEAIGLYYLTAGFVAIVLSVVINFKGNTDWAYESRSGRERRRARRLRNKNPTADTASRR